MPPNGFKTITVHSLCAEQIQFARQQIAQRGIGCLPSDLVPDEYRNATTISNDMVLTLGLRALARAMADHAKTPSHKRKKKETPL